MVAMITEKFLLKNDHGFCKSAHFQMLMKFCRAKFLKRNLKNLTFNWKECPQFGRRGPNHERKGKTGKFRGTRSSISFKPFILGVGYSSFLPLCTSFQQG